MRPGRFRLAHIPREMMRLFPHFFGPIPPLRLKIRRLFSAEPHRGRTPWRHEYAIAYKSSHPNTCHPELVEGSAPQAFVRYNWL